MLHPVFFTCRADRNVTISTNETTGRREVIRTQIVKDYLHVPPWKGTAFENQPEPQVRP